jgi:hypothetical protein
MPRQMNWFFVSIAFSFIAWWAIPYGAAVGVGFLVSPVVQGLGLGFSVSTWMALR